MFRRANSKVRARAGAGFLDERMPGWAGRIDLEELNIHSSETCVLGQLYEHILPSAQMQEDSSPFVESVIALGLEEDEVTELGFGAVDSKHYPRLTSAWKDEVSHRQRAGFEQELELMLGHELTRV